MKKSRRWILGGGITSFVVVLLLSCSKTNESGSLILKFSEEYAVWEMGKSKSAGVILDTNSFILTISDSDGNNIYKGEYQNRPDKIDLPGGGYTVSVVSEEQIEPEFDSPIFGDLHEVFVETGQDISVLFLCRQMNSGIKINYDITFKTKFSTHSPYIKMGEQTINYPFSETRYAYFYPGKAEFIVEKNEVKTFVFSRNLEPGNMLSINLSTSLEGPEEGKMSIMTDTVRNWIAEDINWGNSNDGSEKAKAMIVSEAINRVGAEGVWIKAYIIGGDLSGSKMNIVPPFSSATNMAIAENRGEVIRENALSVELPQGEIRDALALSTNPSNLGKLIYLKGNIVESYFGTVGIKGLKEYVLE